MTTKSVRQFLVLTLLLLTSLTAAIRTTAQSYEKLPADPLAEFHPLKAPRPAPHFLQPGDKLAICGDSITEQKMYSRIMETYLTVCVPELNVTVRQFGWSGERTPGFLARMTNDCLRFHPTVATTCYGMNDHEYRAYEDRIGRVYRENTTAIVEAFKANGVRVILGSPGCVGNHAKWSPAPHATVKDMNLNLCQLRNIDVEIAHEENAVFADVFWPMLVAWRDTMFTYGPDYALEGKDGVHPNWAGHVVMAYAFLHSFGLDGDIGTFMVDLKSNAATVSAGHDLLSFTNGELTVTSHRYPFCSGTGDPAKDDNIYSGTTLVPFNEELNRFLLIAKHPQAKSYKVTWGDETREYTAEELSHGINLAADFLHNPFYDAFKKVDDAVLAKQQYETVQIKKTFRSPQASIDMEKVATGSEKERDTYVEAIKDAFVPVTHTIKIEAE